MKKPSICFVGLSNLPVLAPEYGHLGVGGAQVQQALLARALVRRGYRVAMVVADYGQADGAVWHGVTTYKAYRPTAGLPVLRFAYPRWSKVWAAMRRANADIYYCSCADMLVAELVLFGRRHGRKVIFRVASDSDCDPKQLLVRYWRDKQLYAYGLRRADAVLAQTATQQEKLLKHYHRKSQIVPSLADPGAPLRALADRDIDALWVSNIQPLKRADLLMIVANESPQCAVHMIGGVMSSHEILFNEIRQAVTKLPNLSFHGSVSYHEIQPYFSRARVLLNTSDTEGFPNSYLQAWANGTPVVAFHDPGGVIAREGLGVVADSVAAMVRALREFADTTRWHKVSARCRAFMENHYGDDSIVSVYEDMLKRVQGNGLRA